jgi:hypothetical protein
VTPDEFSFHFKYRPLPYQADFHRARWEFPYRWLSAGVGTGKTAAALAEDLFYTQVIAPGHNGIILCPDYATFEQTVMEAVEKWWPNIWDLRHVAGLPELRVETPKGISKIFVRVGSNRRSVRSIGGLEASWAHVEEGGRIHEGERAWYYLEQRLRESEIVYRTQDGVERRITAPIHVSGTPWPGWLIDEFRCGTGHPPSALVHGYSNDGEHWIRQVRTRDNPYLPSKFVERQYAKGTESEWAQQELEGQIVQSRGRILHNFHRDVQVIPHAEAMFLFHLSNRGSRGGGVDFGWTDPAALAYGAELPGGGRAVQIGEWYKAGVDDEVQAFEARRLQLQHGIMNWWHPPDDPGTTKKWRSGFWYEGKKYRVHGVHDADASRASGWSSLRTLLAPVRRGTSDAIPGLLISERCVETIREAEDLRRPTEIEMGQAKGHTKDGATIGDEHAVSALRYWLHTATRAGRVAGRELRH